MRRPFYQSDSVTLHRGECVNVMGSMPECSVDTIITDPPYHLTQVSRNGSPRASGTGPFGRVRIGERGFMGKTWDGGAAAFDPKVWSASLRVAKPGATLLAFGGTRTFHRLACAIEDAGWQIRDCLMWLYGSGFPKSRNISKDIDKATGAARPVVGNERMKRMASPKGRPNSGYAIRQTQITYEHTASACDAAELWEGWGTGLKPAWEPIILAMKPRDGTFMFNAMKHGVAGLNIDGARIKGAAGDGVWGSSNASCQDGRVFNSSPAGAQYRSCRDRRGRWPANVLLTHKADCRFLGADQVQRDDSSRSSRKDCKEETARAWACRPGCPVRLLDEQSGNRRAGGGLTGEEPSRPFKNCYGEMNGRRTWSSYADHGGASRFFYCAKAGSAERRAGLPPGERNDHPTVKPLKLMEYLCTLTATPVGGVVLDPFAGSGTTLLAAKNVGRTAIGIEIDPAYLGIARQRLQSSYSKPPKQDPVF